jgi:hypothetical protein
MSTVSPILWLRVHLSPWHLDAELAAGIDPASDAALAMRAQQLCSARHRRSLADGLQRLAREAEPGRAPNPSSAEPPVRDQVGEARDSLLLMAEVLRDSDRVSPRVVAMMQLLLTDPRSPAYTETAGGGVELRVRMALEHVPPPKTLDPR